MEYGCHFETEFLEELKKLDKPVKLAVEKKVHQILQKPEHFDFLHKEKGVRKARVGRWRILFRIEGKIVKFYRIGKRDVVYRQLDGLAV